MFSVIEEPAYSARSLSPCKRISLSVTELLNVAIIPRQSGCAFDDFKKKQSILFRQEGHRQVERYIPDASVSFKSFCLSCALAHAGYRAHERLKVSPPVFCYVESSRHVSRSAIATRDRAALSSWRDSHIHGVSGLTGGSTSTRFLLPFMKST